MIQKHYKKYDHLQKVLFIITKFISVYLKDLNSSISIFIENEYGKRVEKRIIVLWSSVLENLSFIKVSYFLQCTCFN